MSEFIAVDGMCNHEESSSTHPADICGTGSWTFVSLIITKGTKVSVDSKFSELIAVCNWLYTGGTVPSPPAGCATSAPLPPIPDTATLTGTSILKDNSIDIIRIGDEALGNVDPGNKIIVDSGQTKLKSG